MESVYTYHMESFDAVEFSSAKEPEKESVICPHVEVPLGCNR